MIRRWWRGALGAAGVAATLLAVLAVLSPSTVAEIEPLATLVRSLAGVSPRHMLLAGSAVVGLYLAASAWQSPGPRVAGGDGGAAARFDRALEHPPETVTGERGSLTAGAFDATVDRAAAGDDPALTEVRRRLRALAVARLARDGDGGRAAAERAVAAGSWTEDRTAAAFLSDDDGPVPSLRSRIRLWLDAEAERERRVRRTVDAVETLAERGDGADERGGAREPVSETHESGEASEQARETDGQDSETDEFSESDRIGSDRDTDDRRTDDTAGGGVP